MPQYEYFCNACKKTFSRILTINVGVSFMVCEELDQQEWDFIQARAGSLDIDSLGSTDPEFSF